MCTRASLRTQALASRASGQAMLVGPDLVLELLDELAPDLRIRDFPGPE